MANGQASAAATTRTAAPHGVVQDYLDVLLRNVLPDDTPEPDTEAAPEPMTQRLAERVSEAPVNLAAVPVLQQAVATEAEAAITPEKPAPVIAQAPAAATPMAQQSRERNTIADKPFASLLFDVMGLKLAAPLHELGGVMPLADKLQPMVSQADWFMGLIRWNNRTIRVVDTARFVMPERVGADQQADYQSVILLADSHWALAVNNADQSVHLQPADIRWRKTHGKRPWLAGTVLDRLCALLDVDVLVAMLDASDTARQVQADLAKDS